MKVKRLLALVLASLMIFSLTACGGEKQTTKAAEASTKATAQQTTAQQTTEEAKPSFPLETPITYDVYASSDANDVLIGDALFMQTSLEGTNITLNITHVLKSENVEKRNMLLNSNNYPDFFYKGGFSAGDLEEYGVRNEIFIPLEDLIKEYAPNLTAFLDEMDAWQYITASDGHIYSLPYYERQICNSMTFWINKTWLDKLNIAEPTSFDELLKALEAFKANDCNGDGDATDEVPLACYTGAAIPRRLLQYADYNYDETTRLALVDGELKYYPVSDEYKEFLGYLTTLYSEGLLFDQCYTAKDDVINALGSQDKLGCFFGWGAHPVVGDSDATGYDKDYIILTPFQDGTYPISTGFTSGTLCITDKCASPEYVIMWADQFYSEEGGMLATMGVKDETYVVNADGTWNWILGTKYGDTVGQVRDHTANGGASFPVRWPDFWYENMAENFGTEVRLIKQRLKAAAKGAVPLPVLKYTSEQTSELADLTVNINSYMDEYEANVVTGKLKLEDSWDEYIKTLESMGAGRAAEIYKEVYEVSK